MTMKEHTAMTNIYNKKSQMEKRRQLRRDSTWAENILWLSLRKHQIEGIRFLRQYSVEKYILDFYSPRLRLAIEVDGSSHIGNEEYDSKRQTHIEKFGIQFLRFTDDQIIGNPDKVIDKITEHVRRLKTAASPI